MIPSYSELFARNIGLITEQEQNILRNSTVAINGMGGVGGIQAGLIARMGVCRFKIIDPGSFDPPDFNRQYGAKISTLGRNKAETMANEIKDINPYAEVHIFESNHSIEDFVCGADIAIDAADYFVFKRKMEFFEAARKENIYALSCPIPGASAVLFVFDPNGMTAEQYFQAPLNHEEWKDYKIPIERISPKKMSYIAQSIFDDILKGKRSFPTFAPIASLSGALLSYEVAMILTKQKPSTVVPNIKIINLYDGSFEIIHNP